MTPASSPCTRPLAIWNPVFKSGILSSLGPTVGHLATHRGGVSDGVPCHDPWSVNCTAAEVYANARSLSLMHRPGARASYSNFGFALLGRALENAVNMSFEDWSEQTLLQPLALDKTGWRFTPDVVDNMALSDGRDKDFYDCGYAAPCGQMFSSTHDLARFLAALMPPDADSTQRQQQQQPQQQQQQQHADAQNNGNDSDARGPRVISASVAARLLAPQQVNDDAASFVGSPFEVMWVPPGHWVRTKVGNLNGFSSVLGLVPELSLGIVVLTNKGSLWPVTELIMPSLQLAIQAVTTGVTTHRNKHPAVPLPPRPEEYVGTYGAGGTLVVRALVNASISAWYDNGEGYLIFLPTATQPDRFVFVSRKEQSCLDRFFNGNDGLEMWFRRDAQQRVVSVEIPGVDWGVVHPLQASHQH